MVNYRVFNVNPDTSLNIRNALSYCKDNGEDILVFPQDTYRINKKYAYERWLSVSNHGNGLRRIAFLLEGFKNFTIDFSGSTLIMEDIIMPFAIINCENVHIKNFKVENSVQLSSEGVITEVKDDGFSFKQTGGSPVYVEGGKLRGGSLKGDNDDLSYGNEWRSDGWMCEKYSDLPLDRFSFSCMQDGTYKASGDGGWKTNLMQVGDKISFQQRHRISSGVFIESSLNTVISDYTIYNGIGMGLIAQNSDTVTVNSMKVMPKEGRCFSINADALILYTAADLYILKIPFSRDSLTML